MKHRNDRADQPTPLQSNMWDNRHETQQHEQIIKIIYKMLYHDPRERPTCDDIIDIIDIIEQRQMTVDNTAVTNDGE